MFRWRHSFRHLCVLEVQFWLRTPSRLHRKLTDKEPLRTLTLQHVHGGLLQLEVVMLNHTVTWILADSCGIREWGLSSTPANRAILGFRDPLSSCYTHNEKLKDLLYVDENIRGHAHGHVHKMIPIWGVTIRNVLLVLNRYGTFTKSSTHEFP